LSEHRSRKTPSRILVVDDEPLARQRLRRYLAKHGSYEVSEAESGLEAVEKISSFRPEVLFLDIEMPGLNGFEVLAQFSERPFHVVFQTAFDEFAIRAFEEHAADYLLKPFTEERFRMAMDLVLTRVADEEKLKSLEAALRTREGHLHRLTVRQGNRLRIVDGSEIVCFVSRDHCTCVYFADGREALSDLSLASLSARLDPETFRPLHRNSIVNLAEIRGVEAHASGMQVELSNGMKVGVSRRHRKALRQFLKGGS
jgi:two-component system LytT family response regulator